MNVPILTLKVDHTISRSHTHHIPYTDHRPYPTNFMHLKLIVLIFTNLKKKGCTNLFSLLGQFVIYPSNLFLMLYPPKLSLDFFSDSTLELSLDHSSYPFPDSCSGLSFGFFSNRSLTLIQIYIWSLFIFF